MWRVPLGKIAAYGISAEYLPERGSGFAASRSAEVRHAAMKQPSRELLADPAYRRQK